IYRARQPFRTAGTRATAERLLPARLGSVAEEASDPFPPAIIVRDPVTQRSAESIRPETRLVECVVQRGQGAPVVGHEYIGVGFGLVEYLVDHPSGDGAQREREHGRLGAAHGEGRWVVGGRGEQTAGDVRPG